MPLEVQTQQEHQTRVDGGVATDRGITDPTAAGSTVAHLRQAIPATLDLFGFIPNSSSIELNQLLPLPFGWQKFLDLKTGVIFYKDTQKGCLAHTNMNRKAKSPKLDLKLNLSPSRADPQVESPNLSSSSSEVSPQSSCVSSEFSPEDTTLGYSSSPEARSMMLVGCPRCLMYVMLLEEDPKCPKCKSTALLDFLHDENTKKTRN